MISANVMKDLLLIQSFSLEGLVEDYRTFFIGILPGIFAMSCLVEYFDRMEVAQLLKRAIVAVLILTSVASFYKVSIDYSLDAASEKLADQQEKNILLMDMFEAVNHWNKLQSENSSKGFYEQNNILWGTVAFLKYHLFDKFINDGFTLTVFFITNICLVILKVVYSLVYYLGYGLVGMSVIIYMFPTMGNVLRGWIISYLWCLIVPHVLVFVLSMIGSEINKGYVAGQVIGGSIMGTALLFVLALLVAFTPIISMMILNGSGLAQAGGIVATLGANYVMGLPNQAVNSAAVIMSGGRLGPKMKLASAGISQIGSKLSQGAGLFKRSQGMNHSLSSAFSNSSNNKSKQMGIKSESTKNSSNTSSDKNVQHKRGQTFTANTSRSDAKNEQSKAVSSVSTSDLARRRNQLSSQKSAVTHNSVRRNLSNGENESPSLNARRREYGPVSKYGQRNFRPKRPT